MVNINFILISLFIVFISFIVIYILTRNPYRTIMYSSLELLIISVGVPATLSGGGVFPFSINLQPFLSIGPGHIVLTIGASDIVTILSICAPTVLVIFAMGFNLANDKW